MASQKHLQDKQRECAFAVDRKVATIIMQVKYDKVYKSLGADNYTQSYPDLPHVKQDEIAVKGSLEFIGGFEYGPDDCLWVNKKLDYDNM